MPYLKLVTTLAVLCTGLVACGANGTSNDGSGGGTTQALTLNVDQMSPVPLVNGKPQSFYMYATNYGNAQLSNLSWSVKLQGASTAAKNDSTGMLGSIKSKLSSLISNSKVNPQDETNPITILDASQCTTIAAGGSCRVELQATAPGVVVLSATSGERAVTLEGGGGMVQAQIYPTSYSGNPADTLGLSPISNISYGGNGGSYNFYIINQGESLVGLEINKNESSTRLSANSLDDLPANVTLVLGNCPNPLPSGEACQARLVFTNPSGSTSQELEIPLNLSGDIIDSEGNKTPLPKQNGDQTLSATTATIGIIQLVASQSLIVDASHGTAAPVAGSGMISNVGTGALTITSISPSSNLVTISADNCSGKTLAQGETCSYTPNLDVAKISGSGSGEITINYNNSSSAQSTKSTLSWIYIPTLPAASPSISLSASPSSLNQVSKVATVTLNNTGNVALSNLTTPTFSPANPRVSITATTCAESLAVNSSCNYSVTYAPSAPSEGTDVTLSGISANYPDNRGGTGSTTFENSSAINVSSIFAGSLATSGSLSLTDTTSNGTISVTNNGNANATISAITMQTGSSSNLAINLAGGTCTTSTVLSPNQSCTIGVKLNNAASPGVGNGTVIITYDNNNGTTTATSSNSDISWLIGSVASLNINFANNSLRTTLDVESTTLVTITNNGKSNLTNIVLPTLTAGSGLSFRVASSNSCSLTGQNLTLGQSCNLVLVYVPATAQVTQSTSLGSFSASYDGSSTYTSDPYSITLTALTPSALSANPSSLSQSASWTIPSVSSEVKLKNSGQTTATINNIVSNNPAVTTSGCKGTSIASGSECTLMVSGTYTTSSNSVITINYSDGQGSKTITLNVNASYVAKPVVTPNLAMTATSLFAQSISLKTYETSTVYLISIVNASTSQPTGGDTSVSIPYASLLPIDDSATYTVNTVGITDHACILPSSGGSMLLAGSTTCKYNLVITTGAAVEASKSRTITTAYNYNVYPNNSTTPSLTGSGSLSNSFNLEVKARAAQLSVSVKSGSLNAIEQGITPNPILELTISNVGDAAVSGSMSISGLPAAITPDFDTCADLAADTTCTATLTMSTANLITSANLSALSLSYNSGVAPTTAALPNAVYSVVSPEAPLIIMNKGVDKCFSGNGVDYPCMNNPDSMGGSASRMKVFLFFTNHSPVAATKVALTADSTEKFTSLGYSVDFNGCESGVTEGKTCQIIYSLPGVAESQAVQPDISAPNFTVDYDYTSAQGQKLSATGTTNLSLLISVVAPTFSIGDIKRIAQDKSKNASIIWSNLYQKSVPSTTTVATAGDGSPVTGLDASSVTSSSCVIANYGATCTSTISVSSTVPVADYTFSATAINLKQEKAFAVIPPQFLIFVAPARPNGNLGGVSGADDICKAATKPAGYETKTFKAMIVAAGVRTASPQLDWVLKPNQEYINSYTNDSVNFIGETTNDAIFNFPLKTSLGTSTVNVPTYAWTGLTTTWGTSGNTCTAWTKSNTGQGNYGKTVNDTNAAIAASAASDCSTNLSGVYCVQQE